MEREPTDCGQCRDRFMADTMLQTKYAHTALKHGASAAESALNEELEDFHEDHEDESM